MHYSLLLESMRGSHTISLCYVTSLLDPFHFQRHGTDLSLAIEEQPPAETDLDAEREINTVLRTVSD